MTPLMPQLVCQEICNCGRAQLCASSPQHISTASFTHTYSAQLASQHSSASQLSTHSWLSAHQHIRIGESRKNFASNSIKWRMKAGWICENEFFLFHWDMCQRWTTSAAQLPLGESLKNFVVSVCNSYITLSIASSSDAELCLISFSFSYLHSLVAAW